jgi:acetyl-CoA acetyltransferase
MAQPAEEFPSPLPAPNQAGVVEEVRDRADTVWTRSRHDRPVKAVGRREVRGPGGRIAIVDGCRTPFTRSSTSFQHMDVLDLAGVAAAELVTRTGIDGKQIDVAIFGTVVPALHAPNLGREVVFRCSLPEHIPGTTVNLACASSNRAITSGAEAILVGQADVVLAGGAEALSKVPIRFSDAAAKRLMELSKAKSQPQKAATIAKLRP